MKYTTSIVALAIVLSFNGCSTAPIESVPPVIVPSSLNVQAIKIAIFASIGEKGNRNQFDPALLKANNPFAANFIRANQRHWSVIENNSDSVTLECRGGNEYMKVLFQISPGKILPVIVESRNLGQSGNTIKTGAIEFITDLEEIIREEIARVIAIEPDVK